MLGPFAERLHVAEGYEVAIAAALGAAADAVAVDGLDAAAEILAALRRHDAGSAPWSSPPPAPADRAPPPITLPHTCPPAMRLRPGRLPGLGPRGRPGAGAG